MMQAWYMEHLKGTFNKEEIPHNHHQALSALVYDYRPPKEIWEEDNSERLLLIGHGKGSSPEIHSRGEGFMLSAGGFQLGEASQLVARPIVLMLDDDVFDHLDCIHINGKGKWQSWNNTGVHHRFAVGENEVIVPDNFIPVDSIGNWKEYNESGIRIIVYSTPNLGLIYLPKYEMKLQEIVAKNTKLSDGIFRVSESESIAFNLKAAKGKWVITVVNGVETNRKTDWWKRVEVLKF